MRTSAPPALPARGKLLRAFFAAVIAAAVALPAGAPGASDSVEFTVVPGPVGYGPDPHQGEGPPGVPGAAPPGIPAATPLGVSQQPTSISTGMKDFSVTDASGSGQGWTITVSSDRGRGRSPVLRQYCPSSSCGKQPGPGYVAGGHKLPPNSLTLDSSGARFHGHSWDAGKPPRNTCGQVCFIDTPAGRPSKIALAQVDAGMGVFEASGFSDDSFRLVAPASPDPLPRGQIYRVDVSWTLNTGP